MTLLQYPPSCSTNETFIAFLLETLHQFLLWREVICARDKYDQVQAVKSLAWRTRNEGLALHFPSKGKKAGVQGKIVHFFVTIAHKKGVICCDKYTQRLNGEFFAPYIRNRFHSHFQASANPRAIRFLQDGDPCQNSTKAQKALQDVGALLFRIPARSGQVTQSYRKHI